MTGTLNLEIISTRREKLVEMARREPKLALKTLAHHVDMAWLLEAYGRTRKDGAAGVDGVTAEQYEADLVGNLSSLLDGFKSGQYRAPAVRRVHIPKADGRTRPIGIPTLEDKVLQRAVLMVLEPIFEQDFLECSYGFRPGRNAHQALDALWRGTMALGGGWIIDLDIQSYFDSVDHGLLRQTLEQRVRDGVILRAVGKWLNAGVMEDGAVRAATERGTPQGGVISPLLSNLYLHEALDCWFERDAKPRLEGRAMMVRYADDAVLVFEREQDARRVLDVLPKRLGKYGLQLHPEKTRLVSFGKPDDDAGDPPSGRFDFLGFTHFWKRSREGRWVVSRKTAKGRFGAALQRVGQWCRAHRHDPVAAQHAILSRKLQGHYGYYGVTGNAKALSRFAHEVERRWRYWLARRSHTAGMSWPRFKLLLARYPLPPPRVLHSVYRRATIP